jgi:hypothetical protein
MQISSGLKRPAPAEDAAPMPAVATPNQVQRAATGPSGPVTAHTTRIISAPPTLHPPPPPSGGAGSGWSVYTPSHSQVSSSQYASQQSAYGTQTASSKGIKYLCAAAGEKWEDSSLAEWNPNDFRIFVGDLGNDCSEDQLRQAFVRFGNLDKVRIVRDKFSGKSRGFGFVSFSDPKCGVQALKEMNGKYIGNRPCKLHKSTWQERALEVSTTGKGKPRSLKKPKPTPLK